MENTLPEQPAENMYMHAVKAGALIGIFGIAMTALFYVIDTSFLASLKFLGLISIIDIGLLIYAGINYRNKIGGYLSYGNAFLHGFICLVVAGILGLIFQFLLYFVIDPALPSVIIDTIVENTETMMAKFGAPQDSIDQAIEQMKIDLPKQFTAGGMLWSFCKALFFYAILAVITAIFVRKNRPVEML